jgi:hypothetical protein
MNFIQETSVAVLGIFDHVQLALLAALQVDPAPEPETKGMVVAALALVFAIVRGRNGAN